MLLALLLACPSTKPAESTTTAETFPDPSSTVCGTVTGEDVCNPLPSNLEVWTIVPGTEACNDCVNDTGGGGWTEWRDTKVATLTVDADGHFEQSLAPGEYALYQGNGSCSTCTVVTVTEQTCSPTSMGWNEIIYVDAPNVYLYPPKTTQVGVRLGQPQALSVVDPVYPPGGWRVIAHPDGNLITSQGPRDFLYYEQQVEPEQMQTEQGWCATGATAQATMEDALGDLGFSADEITDFAEYWDSNFPRGRMFSIYPQFENLPALDVSPPPDSLLRVWFYLRAGCNVQETPEWPTVNQSGFVVREWGMALDRGLRRM